LDGIQVTNPPLGYRTPLQPESLADSYQERVPDRGVSITKSAIHKYVESFLNPEGAYRGYLGATISSEGLQYVTNLTFDEEMKTDPNKRKTYLARFFAENTGRLPSILIIDQGLQDGDTGINPLLEGFTYKNNWRASLSYFIKVQLSILVATYSEEDTTTLSGLIYYIFNTLSKVINSRLIRYPNSKWEVRLPMSGITSGQLSNIPVEGDSKTQVWTRTIELTCDFETISEYQTPQPKIIPPPQPIYNSKEGGPIPEVLNLAVGQSIPLGLAYTLLIQNMQLKHSLGTSNPNIALVSSEPPWYLQPRRQGEAVLYIFDSSLPSTQDEYGKRRDLVLDIPFKITN